jgi:hypothetical protein
VNTTALRSTRRHTPRRLGLASLAAAGLFLGACGGSDSDGASGSNDRDKLVDQLLVEAGNDGATVDRGCARKVADKLSDDDVAKILAAGPDGDADISEDAKTISAELINCVQDFGTALDGSLPDTSISIPAGVEITDALLDQIASTIESSGAGTVDRDCLKDVLGGLDMSEVAAKAADPAFLQSVMPCVTSNG